MASLIAPFTVSCSTRNQAKPMPSGFVKKVSKDETGTRRVTKMLERAGKEPLKGMEAEEAFLVAETLLQEKQFDAAAKLYGAVFDVQPTLVAGLKLARLLTLSGETARAENVVKKLELLYPKSAEPSLALAFLEQIRGSRDEALVTLEDAYRKHSKSEEVAARYTEILLEAGKKEKAKSILYESIRAMPNSTYFLLRLARLRTEDGNFKEAKNLLDRLLRVDPENTDAWMLAGYIASEEKNNEAAERYFREAYEKQPENDVLARYYVGQLLRQEKYQEARRLLVRLEQAADETSPLDPELTFQLGYVLFQLEDYKEAKKRFEGLAEKSADKGRMYFFVGQCEELLKNALSAQAWYQRIPMESEFHTQGQQRSIILTLEEGKVDAARAQLDTYARESRGEEAHFRFLATIQARLKEHTKAMETVVAGLAKHPTSVELEYLRAAYLEHTSSREASLKALEEFLKKHPSHSQALNHLAYAFAESGTRLEFAESLLKRALKDDPKNGFYLDSLGWVYAKQGKLDAAEKHLLLALQQEPEEPVILEHLGEVKMMRNEFGLALKYFERAQSVFGEKPAWKIESDAEWKLSASRVKERIRELRRMALGSDAAGVAR
ncbi:MAG: tetratricopeptide repeat protein [Silvanigrellales bacterium]|nr:tetratricopeptide repeat protein [Silvanigrellales bacterium]